MYGRVTTVTVQRAGDASSGEKVLLDKDESTGIATITLNNAARRNCYDPAMREQIATHLDDLAMDDAVKVVLLRGEGGVFSSGADMGNAYAWYGPEAQQTHRPEAQQTHG